MEASKSESLKDFCKCGYFNLSWQAKEKKK